LPTASTSTLGGVKVDGTTILITDGVISSVGSGGGTVLPSNSAGYLKNNGTGTLSWGTLATVATSGSYTDLTSKPTLFSGAYADLTGKPTLFSGSYADLTNKPIIPAEQIQSDWNQTTVGALDYIKNKPAIPATLQALGIADGTPGQVLTTNGFGTFSFTTVSGGSGLSARSTATGTTASLAANATENISFTGFKSYMLLKIVTSAACWVRIYSSVAARTADAGRSINTDPTPGSGVIAEAVTTGADIVSLTPGVYGFSDEGIPTTSIPMAITNKSGITTDFTVVLTILKLEV
jgi:hypothetical protein